MNASVTRQRIPFAAIALHPPRLRKTWPTLRPRQLVKAASMSRNHEQAISASRTCDQITKSPHMAGLMVFSLQLQWRLGSESNRRPRLCRPLHNHSATQPMAFMRILWPGEATQEVQICQFCSYLERETRFELATPTLARLCSTTELFPLCNGPLFSIQRPSLSRGGSD